MYEGYGYDMDNQLLYTDVNNYNEAQTEESKMTTNGMETLSYEGVVGYEDAIETDKANEYKYELYQFISEDGANYTDLRQALCACGGDAKCVSNWPTFSGMSDDIMNVGLSNSPIDKVEAKEEENSNDTESGSTVESGSTEVSGDTQESGETMSTSGSSQPITVGEEEEP